MIKFIGYWEVWHLVLSMPLFMIAYRLVGYKQMAFLIVIAIAVLWEVAEFFWNLKAYKDFKHFLLNSYKDLLMALIGNLICVGLLE